MWTMRVRISSAVRRVDNNTNMKTCSKCKCQKDSDSFYKSKKSKDGLQVYCKSCSKELRKKHYTKNRKVEKSNNKAYKISRQRFLFEFLLDNPCKSCGETNPVLLDFHHKNSDRKSFTITSNQGLCKSEQKLQEEINKCDILCSNCHRLITAKENNWITFQWYNIGV